MNKKQLIDSLRKQGFSENILNAFSKIKRQDFISKEFRESAYEDIPLPIGNGQTISQPYTIAFMLTLLELEELDNKLKTINTQKLKSSKREKSSERDSDNRITNNIKILEVGSGSGYVLALINEVSKNAKIYGIERIKELAEKSKKVLKNKRNIEIFNLDGTKGLKEKAPFDRILVSASSNEVPQKLLSQLKYNGILVCVVNYSIVVAEKTYKENKIMEYPGFIFVKLVEG